MPVAQLQSKARLILILSFVLPAPVLALFFIVAATSAASPHPTDTNTNKTSPSTPAAGCWFMESSPNPLTDDSQLNGVATVNTDDIWAVGSSGDQTHTVTLIEHHAGSNWDIVSSPSPGSQDNILHGISSLAANDIWAVGSSDNQPFIIHWDGTVWNIVPSPVFTDGGGLMGVDAISTNDVWAVGYYWTGLYTSQTLVEHWTGSSWSIVPIPGGGYSLSGVDGIASNDVWAVGVGVILHWDGAGWTNLPDSLPVGVCLGPHGEYMSVSMRAANDVWAVGFCPGHAFSESAYAAHWNGSQWSTSLLNTVSDGTIELNSVKAIAADNVWAVGTLPADQSTRQVPWVEHWDGSQWNSVQPVDPGGVTANLDGVATAGGDELWTVGYYRSDAGTTDKTLVERYYPDCLPPPPCPGERFTDVCPPDYFYTATLALNDDGIISGYDTVPPCDNSQWIPCFKPYNNVTRGQASKIISLAANFNDPVTGQMFEDVPPGSTFYTFTERMAERSIIVGYPCGGPGQPCIPPDNRPYFRPNNNLTRGQMAKIIALSFGWNDPPVGQDFEDVLPGATFYTYTAQLYIRNIIGGYPCGGPGEPCIPPDNLPYYRPNNNVIRGQTAKIVQLARIQPTVTPVPTNTQTPIQSTQTDTPTALTSTSTATPTKTWTPWPTPTFCLGNYSVGMGTANIDPGTTLVPGSNCDDCVSTVALPWPFRFYDLTFTTANVSSNGNIQFVSNAADPTNACLPYAPFNYVIMPHWDDQLLTGPGQGIYTSVSGSVPFRRFNIEWRGTYAGGVGNLDYEVQLLENSYYGQINFVYGTVTDGGSGATVGLQRDTGSLHTEYECSTGGLTAGRVLFYIVPPSSCVTPSVTATPTNTRTPTITPTGTLPTATHTNTRTPFVTRTNTPTATYTRTPTPPIR